MPSNWRNALELEKQRAGQGANFWHCMMAGTTGFALRTDHHAIESADYLRTELHNSTFTTEIKVKLNNDFPRPISGRLRFPG